MVRTKNPSYVEKSNPPADLEEEATRGDESERDSDKTDSIEKSNDKDSSESEDESDVMQPLSMYFDYSQYTKPFKMSGKCYISEAVNLLGGHLKEEELDWFLGHPQFKHFFHMPKDSNHKLMGMWMLLLRTAHLEKKNECWFIVNGTPIRYSLREMAIISGLYCHQYPKFKDGLGSLNFARKQFKGGQIIQYGDVKAKLLSMKKLSEDRLKMAVLYFLSSVIIGKKKGGKNAPSVEPFFLRAVDDLDLCRTFPWGRMAFDENMKDIFHLMGHFGGVVGPQWVFPSFIIPLELLAFEAIPVLKNTFREDVSDSHAHRNCPRMCKMKFKASKKKGFSLKEIYDQLGTTKEIDSMLTPTPREARLLAMIIDEDGGCDDADDPVADGWSKRLIEKHKSIWFEELHNLDVAARSFEANPVIENVDPDDVDPNDVAKDDANSENDMVGGSLIQLRASLIQLEDLVKKGFKEINEKFDDMDARIKSVETYVNWERNGEGVFPSEEFGANECDGVGANEAIEEEKAEKEKAVCELFVCLSRQNNTQEQDKLPAIVKWNQTNDP
ncbi:PREDICTED: uncharacterized protein At3g43530-like [Camelina sativa]|uniref:Uncharacterized protein At3g43530-like n=1 Tax=Camelina sativa TaxID=90675 RepID=A0ABM0WP37_CAMSA|nr:PREDICTED: uncharacterized protein At3g43530-like [Camelina sativa]